MYVSSCDGKQFWAKPGTTDNTRLYWRNGRAFFSILGAVIMMVEKVCDPVMYII